MYGTRGQRQRFQECCRKKGIIWQPPEPSCNLMLFSPPSLWSHPPALQWQGGNVSLRHPAPIMVTLEAQSVCLLALESQLLTLEKKNSLSPSLGRSSEKNLAVVVWGEGDEAG